MSFHHRFNIGHTRFSNLLCNVTTDADLKGSDHFPITIEIRNILPSPSLFSYKWKLNVSQLNALSHNLIAIFDKFEEILKSETYRNPLQKYELFCSLLRDAISFVMDCRKINLNRTRLKERKVLAL